MTWNVWNDLSANSTLPTALSTTLGFHLPPSLLILKMISYGSVFLLSAISLKASRTLSQVSSIVLFQNHSY